MASQRPELKTKEYKDLKPFWWSFFSSNCHINMKIRELSSKFWWQITDLKQLFRLEKQKWQCTLLLGIWIQLLGQLVTPWALKKTAKVVGKISSSCFKVKNSFEHEVMQRSTSAKFWFFFLLNRFLHLSLNEHLLLLNFLSHFFHLVSSVWEFKLLRTVTCKLDFCVFNSGLQACVCG